MKYLAQLALFSSTSFNLFRSLKYLKRISSQDITDGIEHDKAISVLMFWVIYALISVFEEYLEWLLRWFPGYYYGKAFFITIISIPALRITHLVFNDGVVVLFHSMNGLRTKLEELPPWRVILANAPFWILVVLFPPFGMLDDDKEKSSNSSSSEPMLITKENDIQIECDLPDQQQDDDTTTQSVVLPQLRRRYVSHHTDTDSNHFPPSKPIVPLTTLPSSINRPDHIITNPTIIVQSSPESTLVSNSNSWMEEDASLTSLLASPTTPVKKPIEKEVVSSLLTKTAALFTTCNALLISMTKHPLISTTTITDYPVGSITVA